MFKFRSLSENDEGLIFLLITLIVLIVLLGTVGMFFVSMLLVVGVAIGAIAIMIAIIRYAPMPAKIYGAIACMAFLIGFLYFWYYM